MGEIKAGDTSCMLPSRRCSMTTSDRLASTLVHTSDAGLPLAKLPCTRASLKLLLPTLLKCFAVHASLAGRYCSTACKSCLGFKPFYTLLLLFLCPTSSWEQLRTRAIRFACCWFCRSWLLNSSTIAWYLAKSFSSCPLTVAVSLFVAILFRICIIGNNLKIVIWN